MATASRHWWAFGNRAKAPPELDRPRQASRPGIGTDNLDSALDLVARMLRLIGEVPVLPDQPNLDALRQTCETWARHVLTGTPPPGTVAPWSGFIINERPGASARGMARHPI